MRLDIKDLTFSYRSIPVLNKVSFSAMPGDFICILGENGAGKTTLLNCLCRLLKKRSGELLFNNRPIESFHHKEFARIVSFVPQNYNPVYECTVEEFLYMGRNPHHSFFQKISKEDRDIVDRTLSAFSMHSFSQRRMNQLSGGERKRILLIRALVQQTDIIVLDEPTNQLDMKTRIQLMDILHCLSESGKTIIMTTHFPDDAVNYADKLVIMSHGKAKIIDSADVSSRTLEELYSVEIEIVHGNQVHKAACIGQQIRETNIICR